MGIAAAAIAALTLLDGWPLWWVAALVLVAPDLSMLGYLAGPQVGAVTYNAFHSYTAPCTMAVMAIWYPVLWPFAALWALHIAVDRVLGFGMKEPDGFKNTHLGRLP